MDIQAVKEQLKTLESTQSRKRVCSFLQDLWNESKCPALAYLVTWEMMSYLLLLDMPGMPRESEEYAQYEAFLQDTVRYGSENCMDDKLFLWLITYYFSAWATYYWLLKTPLAVEYGDDTLSVLRRRAALLFPGSLMFRLIPDIQSGTGTWIDSLSAGERDRLQEELSELKLRDNDADAEIKELFRFDILCAGLSRP